MSKTRYTKISVDPERYDTYLVKTQKGTYEFAHFNIDGWSIIGDNKGATPFLWREIPTTHQTYG